MYKIKHIHLVFESIYPILEKTHLFDTNLGCPQFVVLKTMQYCRQKMSHDGHITIDSCLCEIKLFGFFGFNAENMLELHGTTLIIGLK